MEHTNPETETEFSTLLQEALLELQEKHNDERSDGEPEVEINTRTFADSGLMTRSEGLIVRVGEHEYQVTIVQTR